MKSGVKHGGVKTNIVLSTSYVQKDKSVLKGIYRYVHLSLPLPVNLSANIIISVNPKTSYQQLYKSHYAGKLLGPRMTAVEGLLYSTEHGVTVSSDSEQ